MKKEYMKPQMEAIVIKTRSHILAGSPDAHDEVGDSDQFAPEFKEDWVEKAYQFGGWDVEW